MDTVYVFTDCEPDDLAAIIILRTKFNVRLVIAGKAVDNEGFNRTQVGLDFVKTLDPPLDAEPMVYEMNTEALAKEALMVMYARPHAIVWLCSFASLFMAYQKDPKAFMGNNLWAYGSVNLRWAYKKMDDPNKIQFFEMLNTGFQSASIFETHFAFGTLNSSHAESTPFLAKFFSPENTERKDAAFVGQVMKKWNAFAASWIFEELESGVPAIFPPGGERNIYALTEPQLEFVKSDKQGSATYTTTKILNNLIRYKDFQMVFADHGMALAIVSDDFEQYWTPRKVVLGDKEFIALKPRESDGTLKYFVVPDDLKDGMMTAFDVCAQKLLTQ